MRGTPSPRCPPVRHSYLWGNIDAAQLLTVLSEPEVTAQRREGGVCRVRGEQAIKQIIGGEGTALRSSLGREKLRLWVRPFHLFDVSAQAFFKLLVAHRPLQDDRAAQFAAV